MPHLITAVNIGGTGYCTDKGNPGWTIARRWRTETIATGDAALLTDDDNDAWVYSNGSANSVYGEIKFATSCIKTIDLEFDLGFYDAHSGDFEIKANGTTLTTIPIVANTVTYGYTIDLDAEALIDRPCGNIFEFITNASADGAVIITLTVLDVT